MKPEINAAADFLSRVFLTHDGISKEKIADFKKHLSNLLEERFVNHWHEASPSKGQAFRCIRVCPEEALDPIIEKACHDVGINTGDFQLPFELTLWVDPTEVVCKFGDLKCSYHTVAKKDEMSGNLDNQTLEMDIDDLVENARELYLKKQAVVIHPINSSEMHINYNEGSTNGFTMAVRMNGTMHCNTAIMNGGSNGISLSYDGSPRGKTRAQHSLHHKQRGGGSTHGYHYYGKASGGKGTHYMANGSVTTSSPGSGHQSYGHHHRSNNHHHHHHNSHPHHQHPPMVSSPYSNSYLNGYAEDNGLTNNGFLFGDQRAGSPTKMVNGISHPPPPISTGNNTNTSAAPLQSSPTPEQIQQQMLHPPPHITSLPPPPTSVIPPSSSSSSTVVNSNSSSSTGSTPNGKSGGGKYPNSRNSGGPRNKQGGPAKEMK